VFIDIWGSLRQAKKKRRGATTIWQHASMYIAAQDSMRLVIKGVFDFLVSASLAYEPGCG
jgi:hypothetical protein